MKFYSHLIGYCLMALVTSPACAQQTPSPASIPAVALTTTAVTHPGVYLSRTDLEQLKSNINRQPWKGAFESLKSDWRSQLNYSMRGPFEEVSRAPHIRRNEWMMDMQAMWNLTRMWHFTGEEAYAQKAHDILLAWAKTQKRFNGMESNLDLGDYAFRFVGGADILRNTWPGWTQEDTDAVKHLFGNVYWPATGLPASVLGPGNKGGLSLSAALAMAAFNEDQEKLNTAIQHLRTFGSTGFRNTLSNGEHGETGRDQGHSYGQMLAMAFISEVLWKRGIDVFSEHDNRLLAMGEYYARFNLGVPTPFIPMGTTDEYYMSIWDKPGFPAEPTAFTILKNAYVLRKGLQAPWIERKLALQGVNTESFMFLRSTDTSTAKPLPPLQLPSHRLVSTGMNNIDIGGAQTMGSSTYDNGVWTVQGAGNDIWTHGPEAFHFVYKQITGDCTIIARVDSVQVTHPAAKAGVMIRSDLNPDPTCKAWVAVTPKQTIESYFDGWSALRGGSNWRAQSYGIPNASWWVKVERVGNLITTYASPDGTSWATQVIGRFDNMGASPYIGLCVSSLVNDTLTTATFSHVSVTTGDGAGLITPPAAPFAIYAAPGNDQVPVRWLESFGATSYVLKRAQRENGPYQVVSTIVGTSFVDKTVTNGTAYYYVVAAKNKAGESKPSPPDRVTPEVPKPNLFLTAMASAFAESPPRENAAEAFGGKGGKWFSGANAGTSGWLQIDFGEGKKLPVSKYALTSANDVPGRDPKDWKLQGSNDGQTWLTLDTQTNQSFSTRGETKHFLLKAGANFRFYRLNINAIADPAANSIQLAELTLNNDSS